MREPELREPELVLALTREHREIDDDIRAFAENPEQGVTRPQPLIEALDHLRRHIYAEETFLFPPIREAGLAMPVFVMMREHGQLWHTMDTVADLIADGSDMWRLAETCAHLLDQLDQHNSKEEPVIYSRAEADLPPHTRAELTRFIQTGRMRDGWRCAHARINAQEETCTS